jgi:hypothetical protein
MASRPPPLDPLTVKFDLWPKRDQALWRAALTKRTRLTEKRRAEYLRENSILKYTRGYGRWLGFLKKMDRLDQLVLPGDRVTYANVSDYYDDLCNAGNRSTTVHGRIVELKCALALLEPGRPFDWLTCPGGTSIESIRCPDLVPKRIHDPLVLYQWGLRLMDDSHRAESQYRSVYFRDGLMIAILASRAPRRRTLAAMELGLNIFVKSDGPWISFREEDIKNHRTLEYGVPKTLEPYIERYVRTERLRLLGNAKNDSFWLAPGGNRLSLDGIQARIQKLSRREFGEAFGPHSFRYSLGTKGPLMFPDNPGLVAAILGITSKTHQDHYNIAETSVAVAKFHEAIDKERQVTWLIAQRFYRIA